MRSVKQGLPVRIAPINKRSQERLFPPRAKKKSQEEEDHAKYARRRAISLISLFGKITYTRSIYKHEDCKRSHAIIDMQLRRIRSVTGGLALLICGKVADAPIRQSQEKLENEHKIRLSAGTIDNIAKDVGKRIGIIRKNEEQKLLAPLKKSEKREFEKKSKHEDTHVTQVDGVMVRFKKEEGGWREVKIGLTDFLGIEWDKKNKHRLMKGERFYVGGVASAKDFGPRLRALALRGGLRSAKDAIFLGDGADWIDGIHKDELIWTKRILDFYHLDQHLFETAYALYGEGTPESMKKVDYWESLVFEDNGAEKVCADIAKEKAKAIGLSKEKLHKIELNYNYIIRHKNNMEYKKYREKGWIIGSGLVEGGGCKMTIEQRFKMCGQTWSIEGMHKILELRLANENKEWDIARYSLRNFPSQQARRSKINMIAA